MNTKGVEDGITDERKCALQSSVSSGAADPKMRWAEVVCACGERWKAGGAGSLAWVNEKFNNHLTELLLNVRSATPEELTAQAESCGRNYKPGPRQATPFMPEARATSMANVSRGEAFSYMVGGPLLNSQPPSAPPTLPVPERTAEMDGYWPKLSLQRAFVEGMKWWQFHNNGSTAFGGEVDKAEAEAVRRYGAIEGNPK